VCDSVEQKEEIIVAGGMTWNHGVAAKLMEDSSSPYYMEV
jgi:hypothetical protein